MAELMGEAGHVGTVIERGTRWEIVGIVDDFVFNDIYKASVEPLIIFYMPEAANMLYIRLKAGNSTQAALAGIENITRKFAGDFPFNYTFMDEEFDRMFRTEQRTGTLAGIFSVLAILISCLGLLGLSAYAAEQRTKEIGVRKVLGASVFSVVKMLITNFIVLIGVALAVGTPIAWYATHLWLSGYEYRIQESWPVFIFAGFAVVLIALCTVGFQALTAATANPVKAIKSE
jgi:ABC-type antimicrobial peptide transport system permease subunit